MKKYLYQRNGYNWVFNNKNEFIMRNKLNDFLHELIPLVEGSDTLQIKNSLETFLSTERPRLLIGRIFDAINVSINKKEIIVMLFVLSSLNIYKRGSVYNESNRAIIAKFIGNLDVQDILFLEYLHDIRIEVFGIRDAFLSQCLLVKYSDIARPSFTLGQYVLFSSREILGKSGGAHISVIKSILKMCINIYGSENCYYAISLNHANHSKKIALGFKQKLVEGTGMKSENCIIVSGENLYSALINIPFHKFKYSFHMGGRTLGENSIRRFLYVKGLRTLYFKFNNGNSVDSLTDFVLGSYFAETQKQQLECINFNYPTQPDLMLTNGHDFSWSFRENKIKNIVTVGGGERLIASFKKMSIIEVETMRKFLKEYNVRWTFIGNDKVCEYLKTNFNFDVTKLFSIGFVDNLEDYYIGADLVMYLPHIGGGGTGLLRAASLGVPVIAFDGGDAGCYLSKRSIVESLDEGLNLAQSVLFKKHTAEMLSKENLDFINTELSIEGAAFKFKKLFP